MATKLNIDAVCEVCGTCYRIRVEEKNYLEWQAGKGSVQDLLPELELHERELLVSCTCCRCARSLRDFLPDRELLISSTCK